MDNPTKSPHLVPLGKTDLQITQLGLGTAQWGDRTFWGYGKSYTDHDLQSAFQVSLEAGIRFFDTAEVYGSGQSERLLGEFTRSAGQPVFISAKYMPFPWRLWRSRMKAALKSSLNRLFRDQVDLYQIHWPLLPVSVEIWANGLADMVQAGLTKAVGVSNFNASQMLRVYGILSKRGIPLASNQVEYHLLNRRVERTGLLKLCQEMSVTVVAYSPLAKGLLTGKYSPDTPPTGMRGIAYSKNRLAAIQPLLKQLSDFGKIHGEKTTAQVALNWLIYKGVVPIPGAKNPSQAQENAGALGWRLSDEENNILDNLSASLS